MDLAGSVTVSEKGKVGIQKCHRFLRVLDELLTQKHHSILFKCYTLCKGTEGRAWSTGLCSGSAKDDIWSLLMALSCGMELRCC